MRIGFNPNKDKSLGKLDFFHQVVVPVHIPYMKDYFIDSLIILKYCLESLIITTHNNTYITVVNNGSCNEVVQFLDGLKNGGEIQELIHTTSIGKINAIVKGIAGHKFDLVSLVDADVLFVQGWQNATYKVFNAFPKAGVVTPTPNPKLVKYHTNALFFDRLFSSSLKFSKVRDSKALIMFADSIGNQNLYKDVHLSKYLTVNSGTGVNAVVGSGHFVATYRGDLFKTLDNSKDVYFLGGNAVEKHLDHPIAKKGFWRLATRDNYTYHMGNTSEPWMQQLLSEQKKNKEEHIENLNLFDYKGGNVIAILIQNLFAKLLFRKKVWKLYLRKKGLTRLEAESY
ncbi:glycosyltransferase family 2 protein [Winogradskyella undariae]|uniref:glycosyltransferase family A protein n=1 Tax=Winogradskyella undariae TaxID=1285465 RepID=UPI00156ADD3F|nr:glycosyltransferase family A protein [Winogradskyella undariae]NRR92008.1 glycosyltransferase family 2 protein [Winogradskyella undariae]